MAVYNYFPHFERIAKGMMMMMMMMMMIVMSNNNYANEDNYDEDNDRLSSFMINIIINIL